MGGTAIKKYIHKITDDNTEDKLRAYLKINSLSIHNPIFQLVKIAYFYIMKSLRVEELQSFKISWGNKFQREWTDGMTAAGAYVGVIDPLF